MLNKKERMEKLNNAGVDTGKYFTIDLKDGLPSGAKIRIMIDDHGQPQIVQANENHDAIAEQIIADGYVRNTKLHRRFVMAHMFYMLNYVSYDGRHRGYNDCLKRAYGYDYTLKMMMEEIRVLSKLEVRDMESFNERKHFFDKGVVIAVMEDYLEKLKQYVEALPDRNCKGVPYKRIKGRDVFNADLGKKIYAPVRVHIYNVKYARNYTQIYNALEKFMRSYIKLPYDTPKSKAWIDAYKGAGAYYTLKNLIMFHDCKILARYEFYTTIESMNVLKQKLDEYRGEGWRMFALMKKVIEDNNFNFNARMEEIYNE